jgi:N-glycosylase/DNA lyase
MKYEILDDGIFIPTNSDFDIKHTLECGQVFRFKSRDFGYTLYSKEHKADIYCQKDGTKIVCKNKNYIINYLDLDTNYAIIKSQLGKYNLSDAIAYGAGIRILKQDPLEMIISFIISANNNIPRIKNTIEKLYEGYGARYEDYYGFPTLDQLSKIDLQFFRQIGCGYRAGYLVDTIQQLKSVDLDKLYQMDTESARKELMKLKGVGRKVADCILLFGFSKTDVFPTDTWITQVYQDEFGDNDLSAVKISEFYSKKFGNLSGYAQQYMFYAKRK